MLDVHTYETIYRPGKPPSEGGHPGFGHRVLREPGMIIERDVPVQLRDGVTLYVDVYRPEGDQPAPVLLEWGPYGKHFPAFTIYGRFPGCGVRAEWLSEEHVIFEGSDPTFWCPRGYAIVNADPRGTWHSEGEATFADQTQEAADCYDAIEWAAAQEWSSGKVGMTGVSYLTYIQWFVAALNPPHLAAINPWEGCSDMYREKFFHGGIRDTSFPAHWQDNISFSTTRVEDTTAMADAHPLFDAYWENKVAKLSQITVPAYVVASWTDHALHTRGTLEGFREISSGEKWLEVHGRKKWEYYHRPASVARQMKFFDHFLKEIDNEVPQWPRVLLEIRQRAYTGKWVTEEQWPPPQTEYRQLFLDSIGLLRVALPQGSSEVRYDPAEPGARAQFDYTFDEPTDLVGYMKLRLWVQSQGSDDMDLFVGIQKLDPDGQVVHFPFYAEHDDGNVALGWLRASHRELDEAHSTSWQPRHQHVRELKLEPGEPVPVEIEIWPSGTSFGRGETLRLIVQGRDLYEYPGAIISRHEDTRNAGQHVIHTGGEYDSHLLIPVLAPVPERRDR
ncbi:MAG: CocE/NonD family hydrolase [Solirubrobacterales bacterium]|nr:CocE/NonD family hydrolase [Solirubrobacterales bacterium]